MSTVWPLMRPVQRSLLPPLTGSVLRRVARSSAACPRAVQGHVAVHLRGARRAHAREQHLRGVVLEGLAAPQEDAEQEEDMARLVRAEAHGWMLVGGLCEREVLHLRGYSVLTLPHMLGDSFYRNRPAPRFGSYSGATLLGASDWSNDFR